MAEIERDTGKITGLGRAEEEPQQVEAPRALDEDRRRGDQAPADHDPREPRARPDAIQDHVARHFEQAVAEKQYARPVAELRGRQSDLLVHLQRGKADIISVQVIQQKTQRQNRNESPCDFRKQALFDFGSGSQVERLRKTGIDQIALIPYGAGGGDREETLKEFVAALSNSG